MSAELHVRHVEGRCGRSLLRSKNMQTSVYEIGKVLKVRVEDSRDPSVWVELTVEIETHEPVQVNGLVG